MGSYTREGTRQPTPDRMRSFDPGVVASYLTDIPSGCRCVWVPRPGGFLLPYESQRSQHSTRKALIPGGYAMKFRDAGCPVTHRVG